MHLHPLDYVLWLAAPALQAGMLIAMHRRWLDRDFPWFFAYTILQVVSAPADMVLHRLSYTAYFYCYWVVAIFSIVGEFAVLTELFRIAFRPFPGLMQLGRILLQWSVFVVFLAACAAALSHSFVQPMGRMMTIILATDRGARIMLSALFVLLLLVRSYLGLSWRNFPFGIALGFVIFALTRLSLTSLALLQPRWQALFAVANTWAYLASCVVWLTYAILGDKPRTAQNRSSRPSGQTLEDEASLPVVPMFEWISKIVDASMRDDKKKR